jgi:hypothetical protein
MRRFGSGACHAASDLPQLEATNQAKIFCHITASSVDGDQAKTILNAAQQSVSSPRHLQQQHT